MGKFQQKESGYKCFKENSLVNTFEGKKPIQLFNTDDTIINGYNEQDEVLNKFEYDYDGKINKITLENNKEIEAIDGHYILIQRDKNLYWEKIENIVESDMLVELESEDDIEELKKIIPKYTIIKY